MQTFFKYFSSGISFLLLYFCTIFLLPMIFIVLDYIQVTLKPKLLGQELFIIQVEGFHFVSEGTGFGALVAFATGLLIYFLFLTVFKRKTFVLRRKKAHDTLA